MGNTVRILIIADRKEDVVEDLHYYIGFVPDLYEAKIEADTFYFTTGHMDVEHFGHFVLIKCTDKAITSKGVWIIRRGENLTDEEVDGFIDLILNRTDFCDTEDEGFTAEICQGDAGFSFNIPMSHKAFDKLLGDEFGDSIH